MNNFSGLTKNIYFQKFKLFAIPCLTIIAVILLSVKFFIPGLLQIQEILTKVKQSNEQLTLLEKKVSKLTALENSPLKTDYEQLEQVLPSEKNIPFILSSLDSLEKQTNLTIDSFSLKPGLLDKDSTKSANKTKTGVSEKLDFTLSLSGTDEQLNEFIRQLLTSVPLFNINNANYVKIGSQYKATFNVSTYFQNYPVSLGKIETPLTELTASQKSTWEKVKNYKTLPLFEQISSGLESSASASQGDNNSIFNL